MVVDDDEEKRFLIVHSLRQEFDEMTVCQCSSGQQAIEEMQRNPVDAVVTDHSMVPVNGIELIRWIRDRDGNVPIIMVTGHPQIEEEAMAVGATLVVPFMKFRELAHYLRLLLPGN
jgi:CheY-like chemotaxis protein